jgi:hypothetical protein
MPLRAEAGEDIFMWTSLGVVLALAGGFFFAPNTNPHSWARDEAEERTRRYVTGRRGLPAFEIVVGGGRLWVAACRKLLF